MLAWNVSKAEVFNCEMTLTSDSFGTQKYDIFIDTGDEEERFLTVMDRQGEVIDGGFHELASVGHIYFQKGNPYSLGKDDRKVFFQFMNSFEYVGIILRYTQGPSTIYIKDNWIRNYFRSI